MIADLRDGRHVAGAHLALRGDRRNGAAVADYGAFSLRGACLRKRGSL
jgi:hypothetical protein